MEQVKEYLDRAYLIDRRIQNLLEEKEALWQSILPGSITYGDIHSNNVDKDVLANWRIRVEKMEKEIEDEIVRERSIRLQIVREINGLQDPDHIRLLYLRYITRASWEDIAEKLGYSRRYILHLHGRALVAFWNEYEQKIALNSTK